MSAELAKWRDLTKEQRERVRAMYRRREIEALEEMELHDQITADQLSRELNAPRIRRWDD